MRYSKVSKLAVIACSLVLACTVGFQSAGMVADAATSYDKDVTNYSNKLSDLEKTQKQIQKDIDALKQDQTKKEQLKEQLQRQIANTQEQVTACNKEIDSLTAEIAAQEEQIRQKNEELARNKETFKQRIRAMYMSGGNSDLLVLLSADDYTDYLNRSELSRSVSQHDQELMQQIATAISEIETEKNQVETKKDERTAAKKTLASKQKDLKDQISQVNQVLEQLDQKKEELDESSEEAAQAMKEVTNQLADAKQKQQAAIDELNRQREAERKRQEEANKGSSSGGSSGSSSNSGSNSGSSHSGGSNSGMSSGLFLWPVNGSYTITSPYGYRIHPITGVRKLHKGVDISGGGINGKPIMAAEDGVVLLAGYNAGGYGNYVILSHGKLDGSNSYETLYGHMTNYVVSSGQRVSKGQVIGYVGSTGASTAPHLHFEVHKNGSLTDPMGYFKKLG